ncbi:MAG: DNA topoisomerase III [Pseudomonadales bacterium]|nr:DNA topoisomerase III [Pseudomonadales bacterium]
MKLYIAEKPSLGRAIAAVLPKPHRRQEGAIQVGNGDYVSWCVGHLLAQAEPHQYDICFKQWREEHLPIIPAEWQLVPKTQTKKQLAVLKKLVKKSDVIIHAGDPDREGQLLVDQVINYLGVSGQKKAGIQRLLISDLNPQAVRRSLDQLRSNNEFVPLSTSALARSRADWLYGINMTRAYTLLGRKAGFDGLLSVGRVQTPVLGLVARRDQEIEGFVARQFYEVLAHVKAIDLRTPISIIAKWRPSEVCEPYMDSERRLLSKKLALNVVDRITDQPAKVKQITHKNRSQAPPLPYSLSALQIDAAIRHSMTAQQVLDVCQNLYERHKLITYPRSDSRYLPEAHFQEASAVVSAMSRGSEVLADYAVNADLSLKSKAWNDTRVNAHHAIIPTANSAQPGQLSKSENNIYTLIGRQYLSQFYPKHEYVESSLELEIAGGVFVSKKTVINNAGWKVLFPDRASPPSDLSREKAGRSGLDSGSNGNTAHWQGLKKGDTLHCKIGELVEKLTSAPPHFTDASLLSAMTGIARFVKDKEVRKILRDTDGLGTEATRAGIIELLFKRDFVIRKGRQIHVTASGKALVESLPESATLPDMTAEWESVLVAISQRQSSYACFMEPLKQTLYRLIGQSRVRTPGQFRGLKSTQPISSKKGRKKSCARKK